MNPAVKYWGVGILVLVGLVAGRIGLDAREEQRAAESERAAARARIEAHAKLVESALPDIAQARSRLAERKTADAEAIIAKYPTVNSPEMKALREELVAAKNAETVAKAEAKFLAGDVEGASRSLAALLLDKHPGAQSLYARMQPALERERQRVAAAERAVKKRQGVRLGMTQDDVLASSWGRPERVNRTITASGTSEQWVYGGHNYLYFENGVLTSIQN